MKILIKKNEIEFRLKQLGEHISNDFFGQQDVIVAPILKGGMMFACHLMPYFEFIFQVDYIHASRYGFEQHGSDLNITYLPKNIKNKTFILIDDIYDEGITLDSIEKLLLYHGAKKVVKVVLLDKNKTKKKPKYIGFSIDDHFVYGFGMDKEGLCRNLPYIAYDEEK